MQNSCAIEAKSFSAQLSGDIIVKSFFGISFDEKIEDKSITSFLSSLISEVGSQEQTLRFLFFGPRILKIGIC